jgi:hypothetical protein
MIYCDKCSKEFKDFPDDGECACGMPVRQEPEVVEEKAKKVKKDPEPIVVDPEPEKADTNLFKTTEEYKDINAAK